ncbi:MAG: precorrin-6y C5,15-methyltransferase (decarboxylating) subunit CbiE [Oscillospiraceae bacterium]
MKQVTIVGIGMSVDTLTAQGRRAIQQADALIGAPRLIGQFEVLGKPSYDQYTPDAVTHILDGYENGCFCVLVSGDTGFYSAADGLCAALKGCSLTLIPGISSLSYFFARLMRPWQDVAVISCHGRRGNLVDTVRRNRLTFALTGGNMANLGEELTDAGFGELVAHVGENLGSPKEQILTLSVSGLSAAGTSSLAVVLIENPSYDKRVRVGIPDGAFIRGDVPMTKAEIRAMTMSRLALFPDAVCCDIGAGTGSVTVEMALAAYEGQVYALDKNEEAIRLVTENCRAFHIGNVIPILGEAPDALHKMPPLDAAFIGGSSGRLMDIFDTLLLDNPSIHIVVNAVTLETVHEATQAFAAYGIVPAIIQVNATRAKPVGNLHMLQAGSSVFILSGGQNE